MYNDYIENFLNSLTNYEKQKIGNIETIFYPERLRIFLDENSIDYNKLNIIHIAGTKGKGSVSYYVSKFLEKATNEKVGLYISPHIFKVNERIKINSKNITDEELYNYIKDYESYILKKSMTYFEALTFIAIIHFCSNNTKYVVLETGLGGRLDSTNFCSPILTIITQIGYDHLNVLGKNLTQIAKEKAGIIKRSVPCVCSPQRYVAKRVIKNKAKEMNSPFYYFDDYVIYKPIDEKNNIYNIEIKEYNINTNIKLNSYGEAAIINFLTSLLSILVLKIPLEHSVINEVAEFSLPFRITKIGNYIFDTSHTPESIENLIKTIINRFNDKKIDLYIGILSDKSLLKISKVIIKYSYILKNIYFIEFETPRKCGSYDLYKLCRKIDKSKYISSFDELRIENDNYSVFTGSFYLIQRIIRYFGLEKEINV